MLRSMKKLTASGKPAFPSDIASGSGCGVSGKKVRFPFGIGRVTHVEGKPAAPSLALCLDDARVTAGLGAGTPGDFLGELQPFAVRSGVLSSR